MKHVLLRYLEGRASEKEFEELFDQIKENGTEWMEPTLRAQWERLIDEENIIPIVDKETLFAEIKSKTQKNKIQPLFLYRVAVAVLIAGIVSIILFFNLEGVQDSKEYVYNSAQNIKLPDGSFVVLGEQSTFRFKDWHSESPREVWLTGKAFFTVKKKPAGLNTKFIVHTADIDIQVLGTKFSVETSKSHTKVALKTGKIRLVKDQAFIDMAPGELVVYESNSRKFNTEEINTETYIPLVEEVVSFENETLFDVTKRIKTSFGVNIILLDDSLLNKRFTGEASENDMASFYKVLEEVFEVNVIEKPQEDLVEITLKR